ncbi:MAG: glycoside hydrolase family 15 protein [Myxococcales bacterium]
MQLEDLGLIGNCQISALISKHGEICWCCMPRFDAEPVFASLLDEREGGRFLVAPADGRAGEQRYLPNTNVLETVFSGPDGRFRVLDFAPRYLHYDRSVRPTQLMRILEPLEGVPRVSIRCEPKIGWSRAAPSCLQGSNHLRFEGLASPLLLTTDVPLSYLAGQPFALTGKQYLVLSWGQLVEESLPALCERILGETVRYWQRWVKHCNVPPVFQGEVIRSALALKLHCFEDTGAIVAATTTSIPESPGSGRTWDYRYCWLRDSYYVLDAFRRLGHFEERERFVQYLLNIAESSPALELAPLYRIDGRSDLEERIFEEWPGFRGERPVRVGNAAALHRQHDVYGEMVLALGPLFLDERFREDLTGRQTLGVLERLARKAIEVAGQPDAGIWEYRSDWKPQTFSSLMSWAGAMRMAQVAARHLPGREADYRVAADKIRDEIVAQAWNARLGSFASAYGGGDLDASLVQMAQLRFLPPGDPRLHGTIDVISRSLAKDGWLFRYGGDDGFGKPIHAFIICTFWLIEALARTGRLTEAREIFERARTALSPLGLLSEHYETPSLRMWGNFPQAYSHVGLIHAAFSAAPSWNEHW